ncbi:MAG: GNAT family N-acetyltransferase [Alphaproteobacteria bacterium]
MTLTIRPPTRDDEAAWRVLWTGYLDFYQSSVSEAVYRTTFDRFFLDAPFEPRCLMAFEDGQAVGLVHFIYHRHCWRAENVCYLNDLFTDPARRGGGIGGALIEAVYAAAGAAGAARVYWLTADDNHTARRLYDRVASLTPFIKYEKDVSG